MNIRDLLLDILGVCGLCLFGLGLWLIYPPAAYIAVGFILMAVAAWAAARGSDERANTDDSRQ